MTNQFKFDSVVLVVVVINMTNQFKFDSVAILKC